MTVPSERLKIKQIPQRKRKKSSAISLNVTNKASIALGFVDLTLCALLPLPLPLPKAVLDYTQQKGITIKRPLPIFMLLNFL